MASENPGRGVALVSGIGWAGFVAGPALIGQVAAVSSLRVALVILPVLTAIITVLLASTGALTKEPGAQMAQLPIER
jgi:zinc transporter ZupT